MKIKDQKKEDDSSEATSLSEDNYKYEDENTNSNDTDFDVMDFEIEDFDVVYDEDEENVDSESINEAEEKDLGGLDFDKEESVANLYSSDESDVENLDIAKPEGENTLISKGSIKDDIFDKFTDEDLSPLSFAGKKLVIFDNLKDQAELLKRYLIERIGMEVECISKKENLWRLLKIDPLDLIILEAGTEVNNYAMELMQQTKDLFPEVHFICISAPVSLDRRLQFLNAGALDYLTRPLHLSTVAQSIIVHYSRTELYDFNDEIADQDTDSHDIPIEEPIIYENEDDKIEKVDLSRKNSDREMMLNEEIDLIDEDF